MAQPRPEVRTIQVTLTDNAIAPNVVMVPANYPIRFVISNVGTTNHEFAIPREGYAVDVLPDQTCDVVWTFVDVGELEIVSNDDDDVNHGLKGKLVVEALL